jgi:hypothetical protein
MTTRFVFGAAAFALISIAHAGTLSFGGSVCPAKTSDVKGESYMEKAAFLVTLLLARVCAYAVDGQALINQSALNAAARNLHHYQNRHPQALRKRWPGGF